MTTDPSAWYELAKIICEHYQHRNNIKDPCIIHQHNAMRWLRRLEARGFALVATRQAVDQAVDEGKEAAPDD